MQIEKWFFVINPHAGSGTQKKWKKLQAALDKTQLKYGFEFTQARAHALGLVMQALQQGYKGFVVVGGDGTINEVANGLLQQQLIDVSACVLTAVPWGTGNDWSAYYSLPHRACDFITMLQNPVYRKHDIGCVSYMCCGENKKHYFTNCVGAGFDSYMLAKMGVGGGSRLRYYKFVLKCLGSYVSPQFRLIINKQTIMLRSLMLIVSIGKFGGAGMKLAPLAVADDGLFNIMSIGEMPFVRRLLSLLKLIDGNINRHPQVRIWQTNQVGIDAESTIFFQCDGEVIGELPIDVVCMQQKLNILTSV